MKAVTVYLMIAFLYFTVQGFAQVENEFGKYFLEDIPYGLQSTMRAIYPGSNGTAYAITSQKPAVATSWTLQQVVANKLDIDFIYQSEMDVENVKYSPLVESGGVAFFSAKETLYVLSVDTEKDTLKVILTSVESPQPPILLGTYFLTDKTKARFSQLIQSPDGSKFAIILDKEVSGQMQSFLVTFNNDLKKQHEYAFDVTDNTYELQYAINNAGDIICLEISDNAPKKKEVKIIAFDFHLFKNGIEAGSFQVRDIKEETTTSVVSAGSQHFYCDILSSHNVQVTEKGKKVYYDKYSLYHYSFDGDLKVLNQHKDEISRATIDDIKKGKKISGSGLSIKGAFPLRDSLVLLIGEASDYNEVTFHNTDRPIVQDPNGGFKQGAEVTTTSERPSWHFTGIFAMLVNSSGIIKQTMVIKREIYGAFIELYHVKPVLVNGSVYLTYWDIGKLSHLARISINEEGQLSRVEKTFDQDVLEGRAIHGNTLSTDGRSVLYALLDHPRKKAKVVKFLAE